MKTLIFALLLGMSVSVAFANNEESCTGTCFPDGSTVYGTCTDGSFSGYDTVTGASAYGTCTDGTFSAIEGATGASVSGTCFGAPQED